MSLHWGFSLGGVAKYAALIDRVSCYAPVVMRHLCILGRNWHTDEATLERFDARQISPRSRTDLSWLWRVRREITHNRFDLLMTHGFNGHFVGFAANLGARQSAKNGAAWMVCTSSPRSFEALNSRTEKSQPNPPPETRVTNF